MDFAEPPEVARQRAAATAWVDANTRPEWAEEQYRTGCHQTPALHERLAADGVLGAGWPREYGGSDVAPGFARAVYDELARRGLHLDGWATTSMVLHTIEHVGTEAQKQACIPAGLRGELLVALGYSEPESGSDVAAARTTAVRDGDEWVVNGQKMFTSTVQACTHVFLLARTNPGAPKHEGLSLFLVPTAGAGFVAQPIRTLGGQVTNATFYTDVRVPDTARVGGVDVGWRVMNVALVYERGVASPVTLVQTLSADLAAWARRTRRTDGSRVFDDPLAAERIGRIAVDEEVTRLLGAWADWCVARSGPVGVEGSMRKLFFTEADQRNYSDALDLLGAEGVLAPEAPGAPLGGLVERDFRAAVVSTVYGGASEILRDIIAQRHLGLPRNRPAVDVERKR
jgi:alkylation response protein AidB-like acyl-CoA dehydrogenase